MASRKPGRKKIATESQTNKITGYFSQKEVIDPTPLVRGIIDDIIGRCDQPFTIASAIVESLIRGVIETESRSVHAGDKVSEKTVASWLAKYPWLVVGDEGKEMRMSCKVCKSAKQRLKLTNVWATEGTPNIQHSSILRHNMSSEHTDALADIEKQAVLSEIHLLSQEKDDTPVNVRAISAEDRILFNTIYHTAKEQESSEKINRHLALQNKNGLNTKYINLSPDTISDIQESICLVLTDSLVKDIQNSPVYSVMLDESTDITVEKRLSICVRYVKFGEPRTIFLCNVDLQDGCAHTIVNTVVEQFEKVGLELSKCTSLATDGAAVMMGKRTGVGTQIQSKYSPFCVQSHCIAHRLNLACTDTIKKDDFLVKFRDKFNALYHFMSASHTRVSTLKNIQALLEEPELKIKEPYSIRWLGLKSAVEAVYESYASILSTLSKFAAEKNPVAKGLHKYFCNYKVALVIAFMLDIHSELGVLSKQFQKRNLMFSEVQPMIDGTLSKLDIMVTVDGEGLKDLKKEIQKGEDVTYKGEKLKFASTMDSEFDNLRKHYIKSLKKNIKQRFRQDDSNIFTDLSKVLEPSTVCSTTDNESDEAITHLANFYGCEKEVVIVKGNLIEGTEEIKTVINPLMDQEGVMNEWPRLKGMIKGAYSDLDTEQLCKRLILQHKDVMPNVSILASIALCMQLTSVECERSFSIQNKLKSKFRASLKAEKLDCLMKINMVGQSLEKYDPDPAINHWLTKRKRRKRRLFAEYKPREVKKKKVC